MASGHVNRTNRPNTWLLRPTQQSEESSCQPGANGMDPALAARWYLERQLQPRRRVMQVVRIGLDLAKYVFAVHGVDDRLAEDAAADSVARSFANLPPGMVGMEASNGA
jgi:transposase